MSDDETTTSDDSRCGERPTAGYGSATRRSGLRSGRLAALLAASTLATALAACGDSDPGSTADAGGDVASECSSGLPPGTWYRDADGDGFGDASNFIIACDAPTGHVANATDCDDTDAAVSPDALEICDGRDTSCSGAVDDVGPDSGAPPWYLDTDGDGFGDPDDVAWACAQPAGRVANALDCAPDDPTLPVTWLERIDGILACAVEQIACQAPDTDWQVIPRWYRDADGDLFGDPDDSIDACEAPDGYVAQDGDCDDDNAQVYPGAATACGLRDWNCDGTPTDATPEWFRDCDDDGFSGSLAGAVSSCEPPAPTAQCANWTTRVPAGPNSIDCDDDNPDMFPGQTTFFTTPHSPTLSGDDARFGNYNCDGIAQYSTSPTPAGTAVTGATCTLSRLNTTIRCGGTAGWAASTAPACGATGQYNTCRSAEKCSGSTAAECPAAQGYQLICQGDWHVTGSPCFCGPLPSACQPTVNCTPGSPGCAWAYWRCPGRSNAIRTMECR